MEPGGNPFKFMRGIERLGADINRLGETSIIELNKCVIIVAELSSVVYWRMILKVLTELRLGML